MSVLGPLTVTGADGRQAEIGGARLRALLVRLALDPGRVVTVEELSEALWGGTPPADPANALQSLVSRLRRALPRPHGLTSAPGGYRLAVPREAIDAHRFERLAAEGRAALGAGDPRTAVRTLGDALALWRGPALADLADAPFAVAAATWLEEARLAATEDHFEAGLATGAVTGTVAGTVVGTVAGTVAGLRELAARHPRRERVRGLLMKALYAAGRQAEALAGYEEFRQGLADELGVDPGPELREIHLALLRADPALPRAAAEIPPPVAAARPRGNLRVPLTSFVGRTAEIERISAQFKESRLVTLVGPGGAGKTRLATTIAADRPRGAWLAELASVTDPADVPAAVLGALGNPGFLRGGGRENSVAPDAMRRLTEALSGSDTLLVLDNCEHVVEAVASLAEELLGRCGRLHVLATSREPLGIGGEALCPVPPLPLPDQVGHWRDSAAVRLFADRVAAVRPGFTVDDGNAEVVVEICRRLDGLPLAIELAAARLRSLTLEQVAERLGDRFGLLGGGSRTALPRHQTLRAVVAWSWDLLTGDERALAERLSVFPAGARLEAVERVGGSLDLVAALVDKSLVRVDAGPRYRMLETIREYGVERLAESGHLAEARAAHAAYYLELAERAEPYVRGGEQRPWVAMLDTEYDNLLGALHWAVDTADAETAIRLAAALSMYWTIRGDGMETAARLRMALDVPGESPKRQRLVVTAIYLVTRTLSGGFDPEEAADLFRTVTAESANELDHPLLALLHPALALFTDDTEWGLAAVAERLDHPDPWVRGTLRSIKAALLENEGLMADSRRDLIAAVDELRQVGERWSLSMALTALAEAHSVFGEFDAASLALEEAMRLMRELVPGADTGHQRIWLASVRIRAGDLAGARADLLTLTGPEAENTSPRNLAFANLHLGNLARIDGELDEAERAFTLARELIEASPFTAPQFLALVKTSFGLLAVCRDDLEAAARLGAEGVELALQAKDMPVAAHVVVLTAITAARLGRPERAAELLGAAERLRGAPDLYNVDVTRLAAHLDGELGTAAYAAAYARGRDLPREEMFALIRDH
ncbi:BTAD domain-containing putative transcriptional regulator [Spongiactinospora sp. TRM90649]|uniref:BTAD domain-containing putative transcriptional regulator n=1 Tax=Spongiactinospora sp. TRM90649 TaxID=3031114 RepID=UPI0023F8FC8E|nr:BTAD domain-containing putative transcriptional regulator [Spongiactinospora sp. TRM90649]MDF5753679.1 BTAD domain-containing putative transcriptional regulator [Spongiactinospora sp. TRM90649]